MTLSLQDFGTTVVPRVRQAWPGKGFERNWNEFNQRIAFKLLSPFHLAEVLSAIEDYRFDNPDGREPEFKAIASKLWNKRRAVEPSKGRAEEVVSLRDVARAWARNKSDDDLFHLADQVESRYIVSQPKFIRFISWCCTHTPRVPLSLIVLRSVERGDMLTFESGSDEWSELQIENHIHASRRMVDEYRSGIKGN